MTGDDDRRKLVKSGYITTDKPMTEPFGIRSTV